MNNPIRYERNNDGGLSTPHDKVIIMTNNPQTMELRFREIGAGSVRFVATRQEVLAFIKQEQSNLLKEVMRKKQEGDVSEEMDIQVITLEDIKSVAEEHGLHLD